MTFKILPLKCDNAEDLQLLELCIESILTGLKIIKIVFVFHSGKVELQWVQLEKYRANNTLIELNAVRKGLSVQELKRGVLFEHDKYIFWGNDVNNSFAIHRETFKSPVGTKIYGTIRRGHQTNNFFSGFCSEIHFLDSVYEIRFTGEMKNNLRSGFGCLENYSRDEKWKGIWKPKTNLHFYCMLKPHTLVYSNIFSNEYVLLTASDYATDDGIIEVKYGWQRHQYEFEPSL
jgi:hypothetical protein